ncbi:EAL domain-containing protein [Paraburkholderia sp. SIMBA_030]|uniref:EAL domain-containing protein n=1 Tax=Paraburkholderia sp. SIMBA_030 TaxID=3085773 RepID=UPI00397867E8
MAGGESVALCDRSAHRIIKLMSKALVLSGDTSHIGANAGIATDRKHGSTRPELLVCAGRLRVEYQPIAEVRDGSVANRDAFVRWRHQACGVLLPAACIPIADRTGRIAALGEWVSRRSRNSLSS